MRTWAMRGTLHLLAAEDLPTALAIYGPLQLKRGQRRLTQLGLPPDAAERSTELTAEILRADGPLTRHELAARLRDRGVPVAAEGQAPIHVVARAAHAGVLIEVGRQPLRAARPRPAAGPRGGARRARAAVRGRPRARDRARTSPPGPGSGRDVRPAVGGARERGGRGRRRAAAAGVRRVAARLEASRAPILPAEHAKQVAPGGGIIRPVAIADGRVFATWRLDRPTRRVELAPFGRVTKPMREGIEREVAAIGEFLDTCLALRP